MGAPHSPQWMTQRLEKLAAPRNTGDSATIAALQQRVDELMRERLEREAAAAAKLTGSSTGRARSKGNVGRASPKRTATKVAAPEPETDLSPQTAHCVPKPTAPSVDSNVDPSILLIRACSEQAVELELVESLLAARASVEAVDSHGCTALIKAAAHGQLTVIPCLLRAGAPVDHQNRQGNTALLKAAADGHEEATQLLIAANANVNIANSTGNTALIWASYLGCRGAVHSLLEVRADINHVDATGRNCCFYALTDDIKNDLHTALEETQP